MFSTLAPEDGCPDLDLVLQSRPETMEIKILQTHMNSATSHKINLSYEMESFGKCVQLQSRLRQLMASNISDAGKLYEAFMSGSRPQQAHEINPRMKVHLENIKRCYKDAVQIDIQNCELLTNSQRQLQFHYPNNPWKNLRNLKRAKEMSIPSSNKRGRKQKDTKKEKPKPDKKFAASCVPVDLMPSQLERTGIENMPDILHSNSTVSRLVKTERITEELVYCTCRRGEDYDNMVGCDNGDDCEIEWYHISCVGLPRSPTKEESWYCQECRPNFRAKWMEHPIPKIKIEKEIATQSNKQVVKVKKEPVSKVKCEVISSKIKTEVPLKIITEVPLKIKTEVPSKIKTEFPSKIKTEFPSKIKTEFPSTIKIEVSSKSKNGVSSKSQNGVSSKSQNGVSSKSQNGVSSKGKNGVSSKGKNGVSSKGKNGVSSKVKYEVGFKIQNGVSSKTRNIVASKSSKGGGKGLTVESRRRR